MAPFRGGCFSIGFRMSLAFIACIERGKLESQTELLCRSIRRYAGRYRSAPIYTFQPRRGTDVSEETLQVLNELDVIHHTEPLNVAFHHYAHGNKIFACARAEETLTEDVLVFLDSDTVFTGEPLELELRDDVNAAVRPADSILNSTGVGHPNEDYWARLCRICTLDDLPFVRTELGRRVRGFFSAGLIAVRRRASLFRQWKSDFLFLVAHDHLPEPGLRRMDEVSLAATLGRVFDTVHLLDGRYNYLLEKRGSLPSPWREAQLEDLVHVHYRQWFNKPGFLDLLEPELNPASEIRKWLQRHLPFKPINDRPMPR